MEGLGSKLLVVSIMGHQQLVGQELLAREVGQQEQEAEDDARRQ